MRVEGDVLKAAPEALKEAVEDVGDGEDVTEVDPAVDVQLVKAAGGAAVSDIDIIQGQGDPRQLPHHAHLRRNITTLT